jgi:Pvc16 N-terminal domain
MATTAIKDVTRALQMLLMVQLKNVSPTAQVSLLPPGDALPSGLGVNLFLYRIIESPFTKNRDWPGDRATPPSAHPPLGLQLTYLLTPFAPAPDPSAASGDDAHTMLGSAMLVLHENAVLNNVHIPGFDADAILPLYLLNSYEQIKITLAATSLEDLSKIWATINQPYRLSVAYEVSLLELRPTLPAPVNGTTVLSTNLQVLALEVPHLEGLTPQSGSLVHVASDGSNMLVSNLLAITGSGLSAPYQAPTVQVGGRVATVNSAPAPTDTAFTVILPADLSAGPSADVHVILNGKAGTPLTFSVTPWLNSLTPMRTDLPSVGSPPASTLLLRGTGFTTAPKAVRFDGPGGTINVSAFVGAMTDNAVSVTLPPNSTNGALFSLSNGIYSVRLVLSDPNASASNSRTLEIVPEIDNVAALPVPAPSGVLPGNSVHQITVTGARLNGADVRLLIDGITYASGDPTQPNPSANANPVQLIRTLGRLLSSGNHTVALNVDGSVSHIIDLIVP